MILNVVGGVVSVYTEEDIVPPCGRPLLEVFTRAEGLIIFRLLLYLLYLLCSYETIRCSLQ